VSCNIRYELMDLYRAYTAIHDYEASLRDHTLSILAKHCRGKSYDDWKSPEVVKQVETSVLEELREVVTGKWGLHIHNVYITDNIACGMQRLVHEGTAVSIKNEIKQEEPSLI
jgi:regulator of protease activity HflC (stomatin/prohibitin superfamily)